MKVKFLEMTSEFGPDGKWTGPDEKLNQWLNSRVTAWNLEPGYYPNLEEAILKLALKMFKGLEVIEGPEEIDYSQFPEDAIF